MPRSTAGVFVNWMSRVDDLELLPEGSRKSFPDGPSRRRRRASGAHRLLVVDDDAP